DAEVTDIKLVEARHIDRQAILARGFYRTEHLLHGVFDGVAIGSENFLGDAKIALLTESRLASLRRTGSSGLHHEIADPIDLILQPLEIVGGDLKDMSLRLSPTEAILWPELNVVGLA